MTLEEQVMEKIAEALGVPRAEIGPDTQAQDVEAWDSMGTMSILFALTSDFGVTLDANETGKLQSVPSILELVRGTMGS
ncbi:MAG: acyl carrier protein [Phycisphaerae bacterium]